MTRVEVRESARAETLAVPLLQGPVRAATSLSDRGARTAVEALVRSGDATGRFLETAVLHPGRGSFTRVLAIGAGEREQLTAHRMRQWAAQAARRARDSGARSLALALGGIETPEVDREALVRAAAEGAQLGGYRFTRYRSSPGPAGPRRVEIVLPRSGRSPALRAAAERGRRWGEAVLLARDLVSTPGADLTPSALAARARDIARDSGARFRALGPRQLERLGMRAILAVGRGSPNPPVLIELDRPPSGRRHAAAGAPTVVLVGKGVTFDTGGISIKPREGMGKMKYDMAGAAAVLGAFAALPTIAPEYRVIGLIPSAENMPDGLAFKPGDVIKTCDGTTVDVTNTDAEGRLLLADTLAYAKRWKPEAVVDLATLTGAISIALGPHAAGLFTADDGLALELERASAVTGERVWRMPLWDEYASELRHGIADFENSGPRDGGACVAAAFLAHFARGLRWAHLDIASTGWASSDRPLEPRGPTGFGVRLLLEWLESRAAAKPVR